MRYSKEHICSAMLVAMLLMAAGCLLTSCTAEEPQDLSSDNLQIAGFTRAGESSPYAATAGYSPIKLFLWDGNDSDHPVTKSGSARYNGAKWIVGGFVDGDVIQPNVYSLYGFGPSDAIGSSLAVGTETTVLTLTDLPAVNEKDVCFVVGIQRAIDPNDKNIQQGNFSFTADISNPTETAIKRDTLAKA